MQPLNVLFAITDGIDLPSGTPPIKRSLLGPKFKMGEGMSAVCSFNFSLDSSSVPDSPNSTILTSALPNTLKMKSQFF